MNDTSPEASVYIAERIAKMSPGERIYRMSQLIQTGRELMKADIRAKYPDASEEENRARFAARVLGPELAAKVYGWTPLMGY